MSSLIPVEQHCYGFDATYVLESYVYATGLKTLSALQAVPINEHAMHVHWPHASNCINNK